FRTFGCKTPVDRYRPSEHLRPEPRQAANARSKKNRRALRPAVPRPTPFFGRVAILLVGSPARATETMRNQAVPLAGLARFFARIARALAPAFAFARSGRL